MTSLREAAQMALDALEAGVKISPNSELHERFRAALAQPEPEELGEVIPADEEQLKRIAKLVEPEPVGRVHVHDDYYAHVEWFHADGVTLDQQLLYPAPPQREWVGLTDEEIEALRHIIDWTAGWSYGNFARAIEAKLKAKNA